MQENTNMVMCTRCEKFRDKTQIDRSCSNCYVCTACEVYICPECRFEIVLKPQRPMARITKQPEC
jgi:hypothetical protein